MYLFIGDNKTHAIQYTDEFEVNTFIRYLKANGFYWNGPIEPVSNNNIKSEL